MLLLFLSHEHRPSPPLMGTPLKSNCYSYGLSFRHYQERLLWSTSLHWYPPPVQPSTLARDLRGQRLRCPGNEQRLVRQRIRDMQKMRARWSRCSRPYLTASVVTVIPNKVEAHCNANDDDHYWVQVSNMLFLTLLLTLVQKCLFIHWPVRRNRVGVRAIHRSTSTITIPAFLPSIFHKLPTFTHSPHFQLSTNPSIPDPKL